MEEKKTTTISLSTFFLILAIIAIVIMGIFIYKLNNDKTLEIQKSTELQAQVNSLNGTISDLQGKINSISQTINSKKSNENTTATNDSNKTSESFLDEQVKLALSNYLELYGHAKCNSLIDLLAEKRIINYEWSKDIIQQDSYYLTNVKFSEYKNAMLNYVSEAEFERNWHSTLHLEEGKDGYLTRLEGGGGLRVYTIKSITKINTLTYTAKVTSVVDDNEYFEENNFTFSIKSHNGTCVIDSLK